MYASVDVKVENVHRNIMYAFILVIIFGPSVSSELLTSFAYLTFYLHVSVLMKDKLLLDFL